MSSNELPILNFSDLYNPLLRENFYQNLRILSREIGFFYLIGHGIEPERFEEIQTIGQQFFELPYEEKEKIAMHQSPHFRGYTHALEEITYHAQDNREQIDIGADLEALDNIPHNQPWLRLQGPNQWPELAGFKEVITAWQKDLRKISIDLLHAVLVALDLPENSLDDFVTGTPNELLKIIHYPGTDDETQKQGLGPHKDSGILTLLLQDKVGGLQVYTKDNKWIDVPYAENAFIINIGEVLELATNGYLVANIHQVISPKQSVDRYSVAYFLTPSLYAGQIPILDLPSELKQLATGPQSSPENPLLKNAGENTLKGRLRSHLAVTKKFYPEQYQKIIAQTAYYQK
ncbi:isopenicillin N synthase family oxygenase [Neisseriaceae bacterium PsAf]|nr:isopenicillin N synthase family oxygenase [Neisseriaceae bacterium PsAf]